MSVPVLSTLDDDAWDDLLNFIEERRVIPIVGPELLMVSTEHGPRLLHDWVAERLAVRLNVNTADLPQPFTLNDVVCWFLANRGRREEAYVRLRSIIKEANFEPPAALRKLALVPSAASLIPRTTLCIGNKWGFSPISSHHELKRHSPAGDRASKDPGRSRRLSRRRPLVQSLPPRCDGGRSPACRALRLQRRPEPRRRG